jgi:hypothetical protein
VSWKTRAALTLAGLLPVTLLAGEKNGLLRLEHFEPLPDHRLPAVSLVIVGRDEARTIGPALSSVLGLDYPELEVIFVDDRSSDGTAQVVRQVQQSSAGGSRLTLIENRELPDGWLGKVHAQHLGVRASRHPLVLLTDADVVFEPSALRLAVSAQQVLHADHLAVLPAVEARGFWESVLVAWLALLFLALVRPASLHRSRHRFLGVGAFALLRREVLEQVGWLEPLRLQVIDDGFLGLMVKARGGRQLALMGQGQLRLRWFEGLGGLVRGLEKNAYAASGYSLPLALLGALGAAAPLFILLTLAALCCSHFWVLAAYLLFSMAAWQASQAYQTPGWAALGMPLAGLLMAYTILRSAFLCERRGAVTWRGTRYELTRLRQAQQQFFRQELARLRARYSSGGRV